MFKIPPNVDTDRILIWESAVTQAKSPVNSTWVVKSWWVPQSTAPTTTDIGLQFISSLLQTCV